MASASQNGAGRSLRNQSIRTLRTFALSLQVEHEQSFLSGCAEGFNVTAMAFEQIGDRVGTGIANGHPTTFGGGP